jgi:hypothetical protein
VKERILAGWAQNSPEPWINVMYCVCVFIYIYIQDLKAVNHGLFLIISECNPNNAPFTAGTNLWTPYLEVWQWAAQLQSPSNGDISHSHTYTLIIHFKHHQCVPLWNFKLCISNFLNSTKIIRWHQGSPLHELRGCKIQAKLGKRVATIVVVNGGEHSNTTYPTQLNPSWREPLDGMMGSIHGSLVPTTNGA